MIIVIVLCGFPRPRVWPVIRVESKGTTRGLREPSADFYSAMTSLKVLDDLKRAIFWIISTDVSTPIIPQIFRKSPWDCSQCTHHYRNQFCLYIPHFLNALHRSWHFPTLPLTHVLTNYLLAGTQRYRASVCIPFCAISGRALTMHVGYCFIHLVTYPPVGLFSCLIYFCFNVISSYCLVLGNFSFSL